ncbi:MAG: ABC transporter permease, partial [Mangrovicoccus sp.]|nr:ABC transporter permease [Mangrovicoccus sp.]
FNIGGEGQALLGGLGVALACLYIPWPHWTLALAGASVGGAAFGAAWAAIPAWLQAKRGSHIVITTIMFNFIASALMVYLLVNVLKVPGSMAPETARFPEGARLPSAFDFAAWLGFGKSAPLNVAFFLALACAVGVWLLIWRTRLGYEIRAFGQSEPAAVYAGIRPVKIIMVTMLISGGLAGLMAVNAVQGEAERLVIDSVQGAGFVGIAVALMGRSHPVGVVLAAILFGVLYQGGAELEFQMPAISREMVVVIQALVILFTGALDNMVRAPVARLFLTLRRKAV